MSSIQRPAWLLFRLCTLATVALGGLMLTPGASAVDTSPRETILIDATWRFHLGDAPNTPPDLDYYHMAPWLLAGTEIFSKALEAKLAAPGGNPGGAVPYVKPNFDDSSWRQINLPHDWAIEGPFDNLLKGPEGKLPFVGVGWYRKHLTIPASDAGRQIVLAVDGAMSYSEVWLNGHFIGGWPYGYAAYQLNLTPYLKPGGDNVLAVRLDSPEESSRWYPGAGIYRHVWLIKTGPVHVAQWGTYITTPDITADQSRIDLAVTLANTSSQDVPAQVKTDLFALGDDGKPSGPAVATLEAAEPNVPAHQTITIHSTGTLSHPQLWDTEHPHLYQAVTSILQGGQIVDRYETNFGVRTIKFDPDKGFLLNGKHVPLNGVCLHGDLGCLGIALNRRGMQRQLEIMKEMGCNAIRTSHNPVSPELLDLCDQMGILVMNESFDCWTTGKKLNDYHLLFDDWAERDLRSLIRHAHNHPSIILWSIGNEIRDELRPEGLALARKLTDICHDEDPTRPTTMADIQTQSGFDGMQTGVDVFGYNYHFVSYEKFHAANPAIPLFGSETTSARSSRGEFFLPPALLYADYQVNSYQDGVSRPTNLPEAESQQEAADPYVAGQFVWTGFDYLGEPSPYDNSAAKLPDFTRDDLRQKAAAELKATGKLIYPSRSSYFGIVDLCGFPKDRFYYYQSLWRPDFPMAHIMPHWNWAGHEGQVVPVTVFTSGDEAELFLNGKSLGRRPCAIGSYGIVWNDVVYQPGELSAIAYKNGKEWARDSVKTTNVAAQILLQADRSTLQSDGSDLAFIKVTIADLNKLQVPKAGNHIRFEISGPADLVGVDNGDATDQQSFQIPEIDAFNGLALAVVRTRSGEKGPVVLKASSPGLTPAEVSLSVQ